MTRLTTRLAVAGVMMFPATLYALGLGEIHLNSALDQPFDADIDLISPTPDEVAALKVAIASNDQFSRYGLDKPQFLSGFTFTVNQTRDGRATVHVSSNQSVTEPFVTLLVEASWPRGRLLREYTVLLDPPVFSADKGQQEQAKAPAVEAPQAGARNDGRIERTPVPAPQPTPKSTPLPAPSEPVATQTETPSPAATAGGTYAVKRNDTLSAIAKDLRPGSRQVVNQTMIALYRANPAAFQGNINRLRAGSVLRVPDSTEIEGISLREAGAEVSQQYEAWRGARSADTGDAARLRLVIPTEQSAAPGTSSSGTTAATKTPPAAASGTTSGTTTADAHRLDVKAPDLAAMQQGVSGKTPPKAEPQPATAPAVEAPKPEAVAPAPKAAEPVPATEEPAPTPAATETAPVKPAKPKPVVVEQPAPSLLDQLGDYWWMLIAAGALIVLALLFVVLKRRRAAQEETPNFDVSNFSFDSKTRSSPLVSDDFDADDSRDTVSTASNDRDAFDEPEESFDRPTMARTVARTESIPVSAPKVTEDTLSSETAVRLDQQDALAEADFHMAYGLYDQAADLVKIAIEREPARRDLRLKLLEIYFVWGNRDLFLDTARELYTTRDEAPAGEWEKVLIMGKQIAPGDQMFKGEGAVSRGLDLVDVNLEGGENRVDVDLFAEPEAEKPSGLDLEFASGEHASPGGKAGNLDFLLDEPKRGDDVESTREYDSLARTQETPTIESPMLDDDETSVEKPDVAGFGKSANTADQTAELSLDDLGLDVEELESTGSLEETGAIDRTKRRNVDAPLRDDEKTQLAPSLGSLDKTMEGPRFQKFEDEGTGTIYVADVDLSGADTVEQPRPGSASRVDVDFDNLDPDGEGSAGDTLRQRRVDPDADRFSSDVFANERAAPSKIDLDVGEPLLSDEDRSPTNTQSVEMELSELEPVTMSEVGTKLDLARAYMDMGDPDGARSILDEVLAEGNPGQKQEAQRLLDSIR
jgi:pilus assembly protein FimV